MSVDIQKEQCIKEFITASGIMALQLDSSLNIIWSSKGFLEHFKKDKLKLTEYFIEDSELKPPENVRATLYQQSVEYQERVALEEEEAAAAEAKERQKARRKTKTKKDSGKSKKK